MIQEDKTKLEDKNFIKIRGTVIESTSKQIRLAVKRKKGENKDFITVKTIDEYKVGERLEILGYIYSRTESGTMSIKKMETYVVSLIEKKAELMNDYNLVLLRGTVCKTVGPRTTPFEKVVSEAIVAVNELFIPGQESNYLPVLGFFTVAEDIVSSVVGDKCSCIGFLSSRKYEKEVDGVKHNIEMLEVVCQKFFIGYKPFREEQ